jgi:hypothetical protein
VSQPQARSAGLANAGGSSAVALLPIAQVPVGDPQFAGELGGLASAFEQRDCVAFELLVLGAFFRSGRVHAA